MARHDWITLQFEERAQAPQKSGAIFAFLIGLLLALAWLRAQFLRFPFAFREQFAQLIQTFGRVMEQFRHDRFADLEYFAVAFRAHSGGRGSPVSKDIFAKQSPERSTPTRIGAPFARHGNVRRAVQ